MIEYFADNQKQMTKLIIENLATGWTWNRLPQTDKAVLLAAYAEYKITNLERKIIIDQALVTIKHFGDPNSVKYVNAILDKIIR
jgi:N utilization substance protein B